MNVAMHNFWSWFHCCGCLAAAPRHCKCQDSDWEQKREWSEIQTIHVSPPSHPTSPNGSTQWLVGGCCDDRAAHCAGRCTGHWPHRDCWILSKWCCHCHWSRFGPWPFCLFLGNNKGQGKAFSLSFVVPSLAFRIVAGWRCIRLGLVPGLGLGLLWWPPWLFPGLFLQFAGESGRKEMDIQCPSLFYLIHLGHELAYPHRLCRWSLSPDIKTGAWKSLWRRRQWYPSKLSPRHSSESPS